MLAMMWIVQDLCSQSDLLHLVLMLGLLVTCLDCYTGRYVDYASYIPSGLSM